MQNPLTLSVVTNKESFVEILTDWIAYPEKNKSFLLLLANDQLPETERTEIVRLLNPSRLVMAGFEVTGKDTPITILKEALETKVDSLTMASLSLLPENQRVTLISQLDKGMSYKDSEDTVKWGTSIPERPNKQFFVKNMKQADALHAQLEFYGITADVNANPEAVKKILKDTSGLKKFFSNIKGDIEMSDIKIEVMGTVATAAGLNDIENPMHLDSYLVKDSGHRWVYLSVGRKSPGWADAGTYSVEQGTPAVEDTYTGDYDKDGHLLLARIKSELNRHVAHHPKSKSLRDSIFGNLQYELNLRRVDSSVIQEKKDPEPKEPVDTAKDTDTLIQATNTSLTINMLVGPWVEEAKQKGVNIDPFGLCNYLMKSHMSEGEGSSSISLPAPGESNKDADLRIIKDVAFKLQASVDHGVDLLAEILALQRNQIR